MLDRWDLEMVVGVLANELEEENISVSKCGVDRKGWAYFSIEWGDWKHDHRRADDIRDELFNELGLTVGAQMERIDEENGSDCYSATHLFRAPDFD